MSRAARTYGLALLLGTVAAGGIAGAAPETPSKAVAAGAKARASLPAPAEGNGLTYAGEVWTADGLWTGSVRLKAEAGTYDDKPAWFVTEDVFSDSGGVEWRLGASYTLARDLTFLRGEVERKDKDADTVTRWTLTRDADGVGGNRQVVKKGVEGGFEPVAWKVPANAVVGLTALALFLRGPLPAAEKEFRFPWIDNEWGHVGPARSTEITLAISPTTEFAAAPGKPKAIVFDVAGSAARVGVIHLETKDRALLGFEGLGLTGLGTAAVLPAGSRPEGARFDEKAPARTWQEAFLKFGIGFHMARPEVLSGAFHWDSMYEYETALTDGWPKEKPVSEFRKAWVDAFMTSSKHRTRAETDELLRMTLASGRVETKSGDRVLFHAHKNFGGGVQRDYHLKRIDEVWYIVRIDSNE